MDIKCRFIYRDNLYTAVVQEASITEPRTVIKSFDGNHFLGKTDNYVEYVAFESTEIVHMPRGFIQIFPNLKFLSVTNCGLKSISQEDLIGLEKLECLNLSENQLTVLPDNLFVSMTKLKWISFTSNKIVYVSSQLLAPIINNEFGWINFQKNPRINICYTAHLWSIGEFMKAIDHSCLKPINKVCHHECLTIASNNIWATGKYSDFVIKAEDQIFNVHKAILGSLSPVLAAAIEHPMKEGEEGQMTITDFSADTVRDFLRFIYTGNCNEENAMDLFAISAKYQVSPLKSVCEEIVIKNTNKDNSLEVLALGNLYESEAMKSLGFFEIKKKFDFEISTHLKDDPDRLRRLIEEEKLCKRKIAKIREDYEAALKQALNEDEQIQENFRKLR